MNPHCHEHRCGCGHQHERRVVRITREVAVRPVQVVARAVEIVQQPRVPLGLANIRAQRQQPLTTEHLGARPQVRRQVVIHRRVLVQPHAVQAVPVQNHMQIVPLPRSPQTPRPVRSEAIRQSRALDADVTKQIRQLQINERPPTWEIPFKEISKGSFLGHGSFGQVYKGKWNNKEVAIKSLIDGAMKKEDFLREAKIMKQFDSRYLVKIYGISVDGDNRIYIIQELVANGNLLQFFKRQGHCLKPQNLISFAHHVATGMVCLEAKQVMHRDLAARNVLVGANHVLKISDFGLARVVENFVHSPRYASVFPTRWSAPEVIAKNNYTIKCDVWSYGVLLMEIFTKGQLPYAGLGEGDVVVKVRAGYRMPKPTWLPDDVYQQMLRCWDVQPNKRPSFQHLSKYFGSYKLQTK